MIEITMLDKLKDIYVPVMGFVNESLVDGRKTTISFIRTKLVRRAETRKTSKTGHKSYINRV